LGDCRNFEGKHACYGETAGFNTALDGPHARLGSGRTALVIATDEARRHPDDPSELSGGCGAVAMLLREDPRLVAFDAESFPAAMDVWDVARPSATFEWGDPVLSLYAYLDLLEAAFDAWHATDAATDGLDFVLLHAPLLSLLEQAWQVVLAGEGVFDRAEVTARFERMVAPSLGYNRELGNIYGGSLYASLAGLLAHTDVPGGARLGMFAYGSGACAELFTGTVRAGASDRVRARGIGAHLKARRPVTVGTFDALAVATEGRFGRETEGPLVPGDGAPFRDLWDEAYAGTGRLVLSHIDRYRRHYREA
ncbi:MAG: hydroxymethylglutaryl-CoA synthase, partial [Myxococcota bacterium]